ncbi:carbon-nitrogen hydrolase family protein [Streptomyces albipurpureus]|uniref:Carbon-nitrogen hydrolase family protein n=1 Tax=Streptomyces albipurpureus TaxID=2897419 RepID=A0ABT0UFZ8_9ACTN|nr:carbon-nitrogen hydrolase family protein [Streptomyces sp. CWNU-1]MCM2386990.1 carbon-nitrogen hydrolase family protein [Streptomyces sp. CWNU-1]
MKVAAAQFAPTADAAANLAVIEEMTREAAESGAELIIFPEEAMVPSDASDTPLRELAEAHWPNFIEGVTRIASEQNIAIIAPGYEDSGTALPYNTIAAVDASGEVLGLYRKMHLYDAFNYQESRRVQRGDTGPVVVRIGDFNVGLVNCYDVRFPEFTRSLIEMGADLLSVSAAWVRGPLKEDHWTTLLRTRAIENTCWVVASSLTTPDCIGMSMAIDPLGVVRAALGEEERSLLVVNADKDRIDRARTVLPVLRNRRIIIGPR